SAFFPCYQVGGDYFDFLPISADKIAFAVGDVSGKSTPAAMIMASLQASLRTLVITGTADPVVTINGLNRVLCDRQSKKYATFFYGVLDFALHRIEYVNAGHCHPLVLKQNGN